MRSGRVQLFYGDLRDTGISSYAWLIVARSDILYSYYLDINAQDINPSGRSDRYNAFPVYPMCGAGGLIYIMARLEVLIMVVISGRSYLVWMV